MESTLTSLQHLRDELENMQHREPLDEEGGQQEGPLHVDTTSLNIFSHGARTYVGHGGPYELPSWSEICDSSRVNSLPLLSSFEKLGANGEVVMQCMDNLAQLLTMEVIPELLRHVSPELRDRRWLFLNPHTVIVYMHPKFALPECLDKALALCNKRLITAHDLKLQLRQAKESQTLKRAQAFKEALRLQRMRGEPPSEDQLQPRMADLARRMLARCCIADIAAMRARARQVAASSVAIDGNADAGPLHSQPLVAPDVAARTSYREQQPSNVDPPHIASATGLDDVSYLTSELQRAETLERTVNFAINRLINECFAPALSGDFFTQPSLVCPWLWDRKGKFIPNPDQLDHPLHRDLRDMIYDRLARQLNLTVVDVK